MAKSTRRESEVWETTCERGVDVVVVSACVSLGRRYDTSWTRSVGGRREQTWTSWKTRKSEDRAASQKYGRAGGPDRDSPLLAIEAAVALSYRSSPPSRPLRTSHRPRYGPQCTAE